MSPEEARKLFPDEAEALAALRLALRDVPLLDAVPIVRPGYERPGHLAALADCYERAFLAAQGAGEPVLALVSAPSQVGKTTLGQVAAVWWLAQRPQDWLSLLMYGQDVASAKSKQVREDCQELGIALRDDTTAADRWSTTDGGGFLARGLSGGIVGHSGLALLDIDDPYRRRAQAESAAERTTIETDVRGSVFTRRHPRTSVIIKHTRYTPDDLIGTMAKEHGDRFEVHCIPAVGDDGHAVVTMGGRTDQWWAEQRALLGEYDWWSLMQGRPRPRGGALFKGVTFYEVAPGSLRISIGVDFAYSSKTRSDWSVAVVLGRGDDDRLYVLKVVRRQCEAPAFAEELRALQQQWPGAPMSAYVGGTERGIVDFLQMQGIRVQAKPATEDKHTRAQGTIADWNRGAIVVPKDAPWLEPFLAVILDFTGTGKDRHDDDPDALVAARDGLGLGRAMESTIVVPSSKPMLGVAASHGKRGPW